MYINKYIHIYVNKYVYMFTHISLYECSCIYLYIHFCAEQKREKFTLFEKELLKTTNQV